MTPTERLAAFTDAIRRLDGYNVQVAGELAARHEALNLQDLMALSVLGAHGPSRMGEMAEHLDLAPASTTPIVDRLEAQGLARRRRSDTDRRVWLVELAEAGEQVVTELDTIYHRAAAEMLASLTDAEQETFVRLFVKVAAGIGEAA
ncbi:MAG: MarR family transcriptional regulator [Rhodothermales bacterium]